MPCTPSNLNFNVPSTPGIPIPGFGLPFSPPQIPLPSFDLPKNLLEDFTLLVNTITALFPSGKFVANPGFFMKNVLDFIANVMTQLAPFLSFYKFIMALLKMITCIIEVICAIPNPFALAIKLEILFTQCIPAFLALFPFLALLLMIIALLLLILALIEYIIATIIAIIEVLLQNLIKLVESIELQDAMSILAITQKIASLMCFIQNIMAILIAIAAIMAIIKSLALIGGFTLCGGDSDCCEPNICPAFIKTTPNGIKTTIGKLIYNKQISSDLPSLPPAIALLFPPLRAERWQVTDTNLFPQFPISLIITPTASDNIFWPDPLVFDAKTTTKAAPYTVNLRLKLDPNTFGITDTKGERYFQINNCIVTSKPTLSPLKYDNTADDSSITGALSIVGGLVFEDDGKTPFKVKNVQATLETFIHQAAIPGTVITTNDSVIFEFIEFTWFPNAPVLAGHNLTTIGCIPSVAIETAVQNAALVAEGIDPVAVKLPVLPDVLGAQECVSNALVAFRQNVSTAGAATFQAAAISCLTNLQTQTNESLCNAIIAAASPFKSSIAVDHNVQFTTRPIVVNVVLNDPSGTSVSNNIPASCVPIIEKGLVGTATFGKITKFTYDGSASFNASITSVEAGSGTVGVSFNGKTFNNMILGTTTPSPTGTIITNSSIIENLVDYQFVSAVITTPVRRDDSDVADANV
jgi:hypothetical protein